MSEKPSRFAVTEGLSRGRKFREKPHPYRTGFERDRDRIIHCSAFRRLEGKTQVFTPGLDDHYRTRLTHSIEVAQIGRTISKALGLNEALTEAICLAHDLGHPPFGHIGEEILDRLTASTQAPCGFEHNQQSLRIVDMLEHPYKDFRGLNLMYETRLGLAKHRTSYDKPADSSFTEANCTLEGQVANIADRIAVNSHDLEDGLRAGLISQEQLENVKIFAQAQRHINASAITDAAIRRTRTAKAIIDQLVGDCIMAGRKAITETDIKTVDQICGHSESLIVLPAESDAALCELEDFLLCNFYRHGFFRQTAERVQVWLEKLFEGLCSRPQLLPEHFQQLIEAEGLHRCVADYIAGMTDRFCLKMAKEI
ncbi:MAG TPA: dNTP triphosphohydrolase [Sedimentisphaerales bacterium]|nr:dNTP triphosphohydrolase [Sedimentisphaerales bacterium]